MKIPPSVAAVSLFGLASSLNYPPLFLDIDMFCHPHDVLFIVKGYMHAHA